MPEGKAPDPDGWLLQSALDSIVFLPWSAGHDEPLRARPLRERAAARRMAGQVVGLRRRLPGRRCRRAAASPSCATPAPRPTSTTTPPQYYDYALATLIKFQLHDHICTKILKQDVRACDYSGNKEVGDFLKGILSLGATRDWRHGHQGRDRRADLAARADGVLRAAGRRAGQAQRRKGLHPLMATQGEAGRVTAGRVRGGVRRALKRFAALSDGLRKGGARFAAQPGTRGGDAQGGRRLRGRAAGARAGADGGAGNRARRAADAGRGGPRAGAGDPGAHRGSWPG